MNINQIQTKQKKYFDSGKTLYIQNRIIALKKLKKALKQYEKELILALQKDLGKSANESYMCEIGMIYTQLNWTMRNIYRLARTRTVKTPLTQFVAHSFCTPRPYGTVLIIGAWNYPILLTLSPLIDALAAGNTAIIKTSEYAIHSANVIQKLIQYCFPSYYVHVVVGDITVSQQLLKQKFDMIFFTGGTNIGKEVLRYAAEHLTPVVLELGGKSPCIVERSAKIELAAKRIVFGKYINCGQTCVAPDYILCDATIKTKLITAICKEIQNQYGTNPLKNSQYGNIINEKQYDRLIKLIDKNKVIYGGKYDKNDLRIEPTVIQNVTWNDDIMQEEIFGPLLPILTYQNLNDALTEIQKRPHPLALYLFTENNNVKKMVWRRCQFGGGCINDTMMHLTNFELPFGGVGESGMGKYHGAAGFFAFSHMCSTMDKKTWIDIPLRYPPYRKTTLPFLRLFFR